MSNKIKDNVGEYFNSLGLRLHVTPQSIDKEFSRDGSDATERLNKLFSEISDKATKASNRRGWIHACQLTFPSDTWFPQVHMNQAHVYP